MFDYRKQLFANLSGGVDTADVAPAISIDVGNNLKESLDKFREILGVTDMLGVTAGNTLNRYYTTLAALANQVDENQTIALTEVKRVAAAPITVDLNKYRKLVSAEAIQKSGLDAAVNDTDAKLVSEIRKDIKTAFFTSLADGSGTADAGATLQAGLANVWGALQTHFEDIDGEMVFFVNPTDVAGYLGTATLVTQEAFGVNYLENFLGLGTAIITASVDAGSIIGTVKENIRGAYVPANGEVGGAFGMTSDESGLVAIKHTPVTGSASIETLVLSGVVFYAEDLSGVVVGSVASGSGE